MGAIVFKQTRAFDPAFHQGIAAEMLNPNQQDLPSLNGRFQTRRYATSERFSFQLGMGAKEPAHTDMPGYQALLIVSPNHWVVKGGQDSYRSVFQEAGDLIVLDTGKQHEVVWDREKPKPKQPWIYIFVDANDRAKWSKQQIDKYQAERLALAALEELQDPVLLRWIDGGRS